jgi:hypothetical protein
MRDFISIILFTLFLLLFGWNFMNAQCPAGTWSLNVTINPDQYPEETSWYVMDFLVIHLCKVVLIQVL